MDNAMFMQYVKVYVYKWLAPICRAALLAMRLSPDCPIDFEVIQGLRFLSKVQVKFHVS